jgi:hypothetical protein
MRRPRKRQIAKARERAWTLRSRPRKRNERNRKAARALTAIMNMDGRASRVQAELRRAYLDQLVYGVGYVDLGSAWEGLLA